MGNLTRDLQLRYTPSATAVCEISLAVNRTWFDKQTNQKREEVTFVDVTLWGRQAEVAGEYLSKGSLVLIEGRLELEQWTDKSTGQRRSKLKVVAQNMTMLPSRHAGQESGIETFLATPAEGDGESRFKAADDEFGAGLGLPAHSVV